MAKKNLKNINTEKIDTGVTGGEVFAAIELGEETRKTQGTAPKDEQEQRAATLRTRGRKGCKEPRINLSFTPDNYDYITTMARATGQSLASFCNTIIEKSRKENAETFNQAKSFLEALDTGK